MDRLCDEIVQLIFYELQNPSSFILASKRFYQVSQDPYVRAHYFLARHGRRQAIYWALARGKVLTERVIDILLSSGATLSRYLVQVAIHHYFRTTSHAFIKTPWARTVSLPVFTHFIKVATGMYKDIPLGKGDDDGSIFSIFLKESRVPPGSKSVSWEDVRNILDVYKFIPFHVKDHLMSQFPLALSIEPRLLPLAVANGFHMDSKYRDFVFRKMFEKVNQNMANAEGRTDTIVRNVRELRRLDSSMFLSRTVAAEICMEAKSNEHAYAALKKLDQSGDLLFELSTLVEDLIKLFIKTRSITTNSTIQILRLLYTDFPSQDPTVRLVLLLTVFFSATLMERYSPPALKSKFDTLGLSPLNRKDILNILLNPFIDKYNPIVEYARVEVGMRTKEVRDLVEEVAIRCLEVGCKGKMLKRLVEDFPMLKSTIAKVVLEKYQLNLEDLPRWEEDEEACKAFRAKLCRDYEPEVSEVPGAGSDGDGNMDDEGEGDGDEGDEEGDDEFDELDQVSSSGDTLPDTPELGNIGQDSLSSMIRQEESSIRFSRRRPYYGYNYADMSGKLTYPADSLHVGKWIKEQFQARNHVTAVFMTHAVINDTIGTYLTIGDVGSASHLPITLQHFRILARLGRVPNWSMYHNIETGAEFFFSDEDYLSKQPTVKVKTEVKTEVAPLSMSPSILHLSAAAAAATLSSRRASTSALKMDSKKRPRRSAAATARSYVVPDSDDEDIADDGEKTIAMYIARKKKVESNLQRWIKELSVLLKEEHRKYKEKKKHVEKAASLDPKSKVRVTKSDFFKSLAANLRNLRKIDQDKRRALYGPDVADTDFSEGDDDEYQFKNTRGGNKRRKIGI